MENDEIKTEVEVAVPQENTVQHENGIASLLKFLGGIIIAIGITAGLYLGLTMEVSIGKYTTDPHPLRWVYGLSVIFVGLIQGSVLQGLGEIIKLLDRK